MNKSYNILLYTLLFFYSFGIFSEDRIFFNRNNFKNLCKRLDDFKIRTDNLETLNAYDRAEERIKIESDKRNFLNSYFIVHLSSDEFRLSDYNFSESYFRIKNIKLKSGLEILTDKKILLNIKKENAKMIAAKKKLGILELYLKIKLQDFDKLYSDYCNTDNKKTVKIKPEIYEYFFMCSRSNNVIDYELLYEDKERFISAPFIELSDKKKIRDINSKFLIMENSVYKCKNKFNGYGTKIYQIMINTKGDKVLINKETSFNNKELENCIDKEILKTEFPVAEQVYSIYFSVVISNLK